MLQDLPTQVFARRHAPRSVSSTVLVSVVLASGAAFGVAAQAGLQHLGLDFGSIHSDLIADHAAKWRSALAWWAWWMVPVAAFFVGPLSAALTRVLVANWWLFRAPRLCVTAAVVLGLAALGALQPTPSSLTFTTNAVLGLVVVTASTLLAALGARVFGAFPRRQAAASGRRSDLLRRQLQAPLPAGRPFRGGGSLNAGLPFLLFRHPNALAPGYFTLGRLAVVAVATLVLFAAVSLLGGASALLESVAPNAVRGLVAAQLPSEAANPARTLMLALLPTEERRRVVMPPVALLDLPPPKTLASPEARQRALSAAAGYFGPITESDLTFTKGYSRRRAAQLAATMTSPPSIPQLTAAINIKRIRAASLRLTQQERRVTRTSDNRRVADNRFSDSRGYADNPRRASKPSRGDRSVDPNSPNRYVDANSPNRYSHHDRRHRGRERYGDSRFARADQPYRRF